MVSTLSLFEDKNASIVHSAFKEFYNSSYESTEYVN